MSQTVVFFRGANTSNQLGLWETNGTASGTFQLTSIVNPSNLVAFNDEVLFEGENTSSVFGLWATNGTRPAQCS
jgi:ELWxxDGT repeat protein